MVAIGEEEDQMRITANGEDPIDGKGATAERMRRVDDCDLTWDAINDRGILLSLVRGRCCPSRRRTYCWSGRSPLSHSDG